MKFINNIKGSDKMKKRTFMSGCEAIAEAAIRSGCRFFAGYPITPQNEIPEYFSRRMPEVGGTFVQGESEIASINMVYGAAAVGVRAMTSSSGPGISLKAEGISYLAAAQLPAVIVNAMRGGPGIGSIKAAQSDYLLATKAPGFGGFPMMVFAPATIQEAIDIMPMAFDKAERDRNPVMIIVDGCIANIMEPVKLPEMMEIKDSDNGWRLSGNAGREGRRITPFLPGDVEAKEKLNISYVSMLERWQNEDVMVEEINLDDAEYVLTAYGTCARMCKSVMQRLRKEGFKVGMIRPITVSPFPKAAYKKLNPAQVKMVVDVEMSIPGQMIEDVQLNIDRSIPVEFFGRTGGVIPTDNDIYNAVIEIFKREVK